MKLYLAGGEGGIVSGTYYWDIAKFFRPLVSFFFLNKNKKKEAILSDVKGGLTDIFLDSGGYSAWSTGGIINIDEYIKFIKHHKDIFPVYSNLDVIGDFNASMKNQQYMEAAGVAPLPVFHYGSDIANLKRLVAKYDYIALGGLVPISLKRNLLISWLDKCFSVITKNAKVHGFGVTNLLLLKRYPFYSVDSTAWLSGTMRAKVSFFDKGDMTSIKVKDKQKASQKTMSFMDSKQNKLWKARIINNAVEWVKMEEYITRLWEKRGIVWDD